MKRRKKEEPDRKGETSSSGIYYISVAVFLLGVLIFSFGLYSKVSGGSEGKEKKRLISVKRVSKWERLSKVKGCVDYLLSGEFSYPGDFNEGVFRKDLYRLREALEVPPSPCVVKNLTEFYAIISELDEPEELVELKTELEGYLRWRQRR